MYVMEMNKKIFRNKSSNEIFQINDLNEMDTFLRLSLLFLIFTLIFLYYKRRDIASLKSIEIILYFNRQFILEDLVQENPKR